MSENPPILFKNRRFQGAAPGSHLFFGTLVSGNNSLESNRRAEVFAWKSHTAPEGRTGDGAEEGDLPWTPMDLQRFHRNYRGFQCFSSLFIELV